MEELLKLKTDEQWQEAVNAAYTYLLLNEACQLDLIASDGDVEIDVESCERLLEVARGRGIEPSEDAVEKWAPELRGQGFKSTPGARERWLNLFGRRDSNEG